MKRLVGAQGLEPWTRCLKGSCSINGSSIGLRNSSVVVMEQAYAIFIVDKIQKKLREDPHKIPHRAL